MSPKDDYRLSLYDFRNVCGTSEEDPIRQPLMLILEEMYNKQSRIGYHFLYFLKARYIHNTHLTTLY